MKLVTYIGRCKSLTKHGHKFTDVKKTAIMDDTTADKFTNFEDFTISNIPEAEVVPDTKVEQVDDTQEVVVDAELEAKKKKLLKMSVETLKEMCENAGLDNQGKKEELVNRLLTPQV